MVLAAEVLLVYCVALGFEEWVFFFAPFLFEAGGRGEEGEGGEGGGIRMWANFWGIQSIYDRDLCEEGWGGERGEEGEVKLKQKGEGTQAQGRPTEGVSTLLAVGAEFNIDKAQLNGALG